MTEGRMAQVMGQGDRLCQFRAEAASESRLVHQKIVGYGTGELSRFNAVSQPGAIEIRLTNAEYLGLSLQPAKSGAVKYSVPIALRGMPMVSGRLRPFRVLPFKKKLVHEMYREAYR